MIIKEAMRLFPPVEGISRQATKFVILCRYKIPDRLGSLLFEINTIRPITKFCF